MKMIVSACLADICCRYNGSACPGPFTERLKTLIASGNAVPVCPEVLGGLPVPREPMEVRNGRVYTRSGEDLTDPCLNGAEAALQLAAGSDPPELALLKSRSPSCGVHRIYDGTFSGTLVPGEGLFTQLLRSVYPDMEIVDETEIFDL